MYALARDPSGTLSEAGVVRRADGAWIPRDPENRDWQAYAAWRAAGNAPAEPPAPPAPVPEAISDRQFAQALALDGTITQAEALAWAARGELPAAMTSALSKIPEADGQRFGAHMLLAAATTYERRHPLTQQLGALLGYAAAALDALWTRAAKL